MAYNAPLEYKVDVREFIKLPHNDASSAYNKYIQATTKAVVDAINEGATIAQIDKIITTKNKAFYTSIHKEFTENMVRYSQRDWEVLAKEDSYGITMKKRLNKSINRSFTMMRNKSRTLHFRINNNKSAEDFDKLVTKFVKEYANTVTSSLSNNSSVLNDTQKQFYKREREHSKLEGRVIWRYGHTKNHCPICKANVGKIFKSMASAPPCPAHPRCECYYEDAD